MKKPLLIFCCLIGLSAFNQVSAQNNLDIVNNTSCGFLLLAEETHPVTCLPGTSSTTPVGPTSTFTVTLSGAPYIVNKIYITDCVGAGAKLWDFTMCASDNRLKRVLPASACCPTGASILFTPATSTTNALITIN